MFDHLCTYNRCRFIGVKEKWPLTEAKMGSGFNAKILCYFNKLIVQHVPEIKRRESWRRWLSRVLSDVQIFRDQFWNFPTCNCKNCKFHSDLNHERKTAEPTAATSDWKTIKGCLKWGLAGTFRSCWVLKIHNRMWESIPPWSMKRKYWVCILWCPLGWNISF